MGHRGIKQLIKMLMNNMHENSVWGRPAETNPLSSNRTEKRDQQVHKTVRAIYPPGDSCFIFFLHSRIHFKIIKHCLICASKCPTQSHQTSDMKKVKKTWSLTEKSLHLIGRPLSLDCIQQLNIMLSF